MLDMLKIATAFVLLSAVSAPTFGAERYFGADLSHANEMIDCGARYRDTNGQINDVYSLFSGHGANLVEVGIFTDGNASRYHDLLDVVRSIRNAKFRGLKTVLAFHYSDSESGAGKNDIPRNWAEISDNQALAQTLYQYTFYVLTTLDRQDLMPDMVRLPAAPATSRMGDIAVLNAGIKAVRDAGLKSKARVRVMLLLDQPGSAEDWVAESAKSGIAKYDLIDIRYEPRAVRDLAAISETIGRLRKNYTEKDVIVESAYPATDVEVSKRALLSGYPATPEGQRKYLSDLSIAVLHAGGSGLIYEAPELVANKCAAGEPGSAIALFDRDGKVLPGIEFGKLGRVVRP